MSNRKAQIAGVVNCQGCGLRIIQKRADQLYCNENCRRWSSARSQSTRERSDFTDKMVADLYADALAGKIRAWPDDDEEAPE